MGLTVLALADADANSHTSHPEQFPGDFSLGGY